MTLPHQNASYTNYELLPREHSDYGTLLKASLSLLGWSTTKKTDSQEEKGKNKILYIILNEGTGSKNKGFDPSKLYQISNRR